MRHRLSQLLNSIWYGRNPLWVVLWPFSLLYRVLYGLVDLSTKPAANTDGRFVPVVVVGNITAGGTGKTPLIIWLARELHGQNLKVGIVSRGYGGSRSQFPHVVKPDASPRDFGDEPVLIAQSTECPVAVCVDRTKAKDLLLSKHDLDLVLSDDGLQHKRLQRCCEIVVVDGTRGLGNGLCLPAGPLREPPERLEHVDAVVINGAGWERPGAIRIQVRLTGFRRLSDGVVKSVAEFQGQTAHAIAGIGNPQRFFSLLREHGIGVIEHALPDHAWIGPDDFPFGRDALVMMTEKDAVKWPASITKNAWSAKTEVVIDESQKEQLLDVVKQSIKGPVK